jgi:glycerol-3-phosphate acyltransferase PlsY
MIKIIIYSLSIVATYLLGSIPSSVWIGKYFYGIDVREYGSKNAGATNTFRVLGKKAGILTLIFDVLKGWAAVKLANFAAPEIITESGYKDLQLLLAMAAVLGHIFPVYVGFRGGKGVATLLGAVLAIQPDAAGFSFLIFLIVFIATNFVSLSSMTAAVAFPFYIIVIEKSTIPSLVIFSMAVAILVLITHQKNIERLIHHKESKIYLFKNERTG